MVNERLEHVSVFLQCDGMLVSGRFEFHNQGFCSVLFVLCVCGGPHVPQQAVAWEDTVVKGATERLECFGIPHSGSFECKPPCMDPMTPAAEMLVLCQALL